MNYFFSRYKFDKIENKKRIEEVLPNTNINIEFSNIDFNSTESQFIKFVEDKYGLKIKNYIMPLYRGTKHKGKCTIIVETKEEAYKILSLNGMVYYLCSFTL